MIRRALVATLLVYVSLDLALPDVPGVFVFDPEGSLEGVDTGRARPTTRTVAVPAPALETAVWLRNNGGGDHPRGYRMEVRRRPDLGASYLARAACSSPPPAEDPH